MIDIRLAVAAACHAVAAVAFALAAGVVGAALWGKPTLSFLWFLPSRLGLAGLILRDWADIVTALAASGVVFVVLCTLPLILLLWQLGK